MGGAGTKVYSIATALGGTISRQGFSFFQARMCLASDISTGTLQGRARELL